MPNLSDPLHECQATPRLRARLAPSTPRPANSSATQPTVNREVELAAVLREVDDRAAQQSAR